MSATIQTKVFARYYSVPVGDRLYPCPILKVKGRTYEVKEFYLEDLRKLGEVRDSIYVIIIMIERQTERMILLFGTFK